MTLIVIVVLVIAFLVYLAYLGHVSRSGSANGLINGMLSPCPGTPNCVCSEHPDHSAQAIEPIALRGESAAVALQRLKQIIELQGGRIATTDDNYIAAIFTSPLFGFVDDLEVRIDTATDAVHLRSASRVGTDDLGANAKRVDMIKNLYREKQ